MIKAGRRWPVFWICLVWLAASLTGCGQASVAPEAPGVSVATTPSETELSPADTLYTFAVCGDNRIDGIENGVLERIVVSAKARGAAFIVDTGDVTTDGSRAELESYRTFTEESGIKFYTVPGNHDVGAGGVSAAYSEIIGPTYFSFDFGGDHFVIVDNADDNSGIDEVQLRWLAQDLSAHRGQPHRFLFAHIPLASPSLPSRHTAGEKGVAGLESGKELVRLAQQHAVSGLFFGHIHAYLAYQVDGLPAYITGGAGAPLYLPEGAGGFYHYLLVRVGRQGEVSVEVVRV